MLFPAENRSASAGRTHISLNGDFSFSISAIRHTAAALDAGERDRIDEVVGGAWDVLRQADAHFGFRTGKAIVRFVNEAKASSGGAMTLDDAIDAQLVQKVLVKLRGEGDRWAKPLEELREKFALLTGRRRSVAVVERMLGDLERLGSFQFWS